VGTGEDSGGRIGRAPIVIRRGYAALHRRAARFLEEDEKLLWAVAGRTVPLGAADSFLEAARQAPGLLSGEDRQELVLRTDRAVRLMKTRAFSVWRPKKELERFPLDAPVTVELSTDESGGVLDVGSHHLYFGPYAVDDAKAIATDLRHDTGPRWRRLLDSPADPT
jgi:hypothetical protein